MTWIIWRQQRPVLISLAIAAVIGVAAALLLRASMTADLVAQGLTGCVPEGSRLGTDCGREAADDFQNAWLDRMKIGQYLVVALPALIGIFVGAPLFAREFEQGTHVLAFTQSVSRTRWMITKLAVSVAPALVAVLVVQFAVGAWVAAAGRLGPLFPGPFTAHNFGSSGISPVVYTLFAYTLGMFVGALSRRTLMGMTLTLVVFAAVRTVVHGIHQFLLPAQRFTSDVYRTPDVGGGLYTGGGYLDTKGQVVADHMTKLNRCASRTGEPPGGDQCLQQQGLANTYTDMIPAGSAGTMHLVEAAIYLGFTALFVLGTVWAVRRQQ